MIRLWLLIVSFFCITSQAREAKPLYNLHCEVHTIVSVYYDGVFSLDENQFVSDFMVTIIDHPLWIKKDEIQLNVNQKDGQFLLKFEHLHPSNDGRFVRIDISGEQSLISQDFGSVFFDDRRAYCSITQKTFIR